MNTSPLDDTYQRPNSTSLAPLALVAQQSCAYFDKVRRFFG